MDQKKTRPSIVINIFVVFAIVGLIWIKMTPRFHSYKRESFLALIILDSLGEYFFRRLECDGMRLEGEVDKIHTYNICSLRTSLTHLQCDLLLFGDFRTVYRVLWLIAHVDKIIFIISSNRAFSLIRLLAFYLILFYPPRFLQNSFLFLVYLVRGTLVKNFSFDQCC